MCSSPTTARTSRASPEATASPELVGVRVRTGDGGIEGGRELDPRRFVQSRERLREHAARLPIEEVQTEEPSFVARALLHTGRLTRRHRDRREAQTQCGAGAGELLRDDLVP